MIFEGLTVARIVVSIVAGLALGTFYFWGLWWTSRRVATTQVPGLLFSVSFIVRMAVLLGGMYVITRGRVVETSLCVIGLLVARHMVVARVRSGVSDRDGDTDRNADETSSEG